MSFKNRAKFLMHL